MNADLFDWLPPPDAPPDVLAAAYARAVDGGVPIVGSAAKRQGPSVIPVLVIDTSARPELSRFLAAVARRGGLGDAPEEQSATSLHLIAPPDRSPIVVVAVTPPDVAPEGGFWCVLDLANGVQAAAATIAVRERFVAISDSEPDAAGNLPALLMLVEGSLEATPAELVRRALPALAPPGPATVIPGAVARVIAEADRDTIPHRVVYAESARGRVVVYVNQPADRARRPADRVYLWSTQTSGTLEHARLSKGWQAISLQTLRYRGPGRAVVVTETVVAWAPSSSPWEALVDAAGRSRQPMLLGIRLNAYFLAQTAGLDEASRHAWLPMLDTLITALPRLSAYADLEQRDDRAFLVGLAGAARGLWHDHRAETAQQILSGMSRVVFKALVALAASWRWSGPPPTAHAANPDLGLPQMVAAAFRQHLVLYGPDVPPPPPLVRAWLDDDFEGVWQSWGAPSAPIGGEALAVLRDAVTEALEAIDPAPVLAGTFAPRLPWRVPALRELAVEALWVHARGDGWRWVRLVPEGGRGGIVLPWRPGLTPPPVWSLALRARARAEIHLYLLGWERDMRREGPERVLFRAREERLSAQPQRAAQPDQAAGTAPRRGRRAAIQAPRGRTEVVRLGETAIAGEYVHPGDRAAIERRVADLHRVRQHIVSYIRPRRASAGQIARWQRLTRLERRYYFKQADLGPNETPRGLREGPDGRLMLGYQRGKADSRRAPAPVVAQGALNVAMAIRLMDEAEAEAARAAADLAAAAQDAPSGAAGDAATGPGSAAQGGFLRAFDAQIAADIAD